MNVPCFLDELNNSMEAVLLALKQRVRDDVRKRESRDHHKLRVFDIGSLVMLRIPGLHGSLEASWEGPYKIVARTSEVNYRVIPVGSKVVHVVVAVHDDSQVISNSISSEGLNPSLLLILMISSSFLSHGMIIYPISIKFYHVSTIMVLL